MKKFKELVRRQGGDLSYIEHFEKYPKSAITLEIKSASAGSIDTIDALEIGLTSIMIGAGRVKVGVNMLVVSEG